MPGHEPLPLAGVLLGLQWMSNWAQRKWAKFSKKETKLARRAAAEAQAALEAAEERDQENFLELASWLQARGAYINEAVGLARSPSAGRFLRAKREVRNGELLLEIPTACCFSVTPGAYEKLFDAKLCAALEAGGIRKEMAELALALAVERRQGEATADCLTEESAWLPYVQMLECTPSFPHFYKDSDLDLLENPPLKESLEARTRALQLLAAKSRMNEVDVKEAMQIVLGRAFTCDLLTCMLPVGDMLNHTFYPSCEVEAPSVGAESWKLRSKMDLKPGEELSWCYCEDPNHLLLQASGFVMQENPHNRIMARPSDLRKALLSVCNEKSPEDFDKERRKKFIEALPDPEEEGVGLSMFLVGRQPGGIQWNPLWLDLIGFAVTESPDAQHWGKTPEGMKHYFQALEKASWSLFPRNLKDDTESFTEKNEELAAVLRRGYKKLLQEALDGLKTRLSG